MADIRVNQLPLATGPTAPMQSDFVPIDGTTTRKATLLSLADVINPPASQAEAEAGTDAVKRMTPLTTAQAIDFLVSTAGLSGAYADLTGKPTLGNSSPLDVGTIAGTVAAGNDSRITGAVQSSYLTPRLPGLSDNVQGTGYPGLDGGPWFIYQHPASFTEKPALWVQKDYLAGGLAGGNTYPTLWVVGNTNANDAGFAWIANIQLNNKTKKTTSAENVAVNAYAKKQPTGDGTETGPTWGANIVAQDDTGFANPTAGLIGAEIAASAAGGDPNRTRRALQLVAGGPSGTTIGYGLMIGARPNVVFDKPLALVSTGGGSFNVGLDTTDATIVSNIAVMVKEGQKWGLDGNFAGAVNRTIYYSSGLFRYDTPSGNVFNISDAGNVGIAGQISIGGANANSGSGGAASALPANPVGYFPITYGGVTRRVPYYNT